MVTTHPEGAHRRCSYCLNALMQVLTAHLSECSPQLTLLTCHMCSCVALQAAARLRSVTSCAVQVYCFTAMAKAVPQDTLKKLVGVVLLQLISPDRSHVDSDNTFLKALNVLMMRVLANSQK